MLSVRKVLIMVKEIMEFIGKDALASAKQKLPRLLVCIKMIDRGIPRKGYIIIIDGKAIGEVTSGTQSPSLKEGIGIAYVSTQYAKVGTKLGMAIRNKILNCIVVDSPFYKEGTVKS